MNKKGGDKKWQRQKRKSGEEPNIKRLGKEPNIQKRKSVEGRNTQRRRKEHHAVRNSKRLRFFHEYHSFVKDANHHLHKFNPSISLFGSLSRHKKNPRDIDVAVDTRQLTDRQFKEAMNKIKELKKKYKHVDPVLYSWNTKRLPPKRIRDKLRWNKDAWDWYNKI